ncbi:UvrABC system protein A [Streptomyces acidiscabies]|nr:UvrABC system protein A [Streptomyces acidiscabies]
MELPNNALTVFTRVSGSGKSSLAVDTIFAERERRYAESLSACARQLTKPDTDVLLKATPEPVPTHPADRSPHPLPEAS